VQVNESARVEAFSDGVIAIAITLLVLEIRVPEVEGGLGHALARQWPSYAAYALTFLVIGIMWINHHAMFEQIVRIDRGLMLLNIMLLMGIAFLPFPTALVARYLREGNDGRVATAVYALTMVLIGCGYLALWSYLERHPRLLRPDFGAAGARQVFRRTLVGPSLYGVSFLVALVAPVAALVVWAGLAVYFMFPAASQRRRDDVEEGGAP
jgi:uncharacterized membrane protein